MMSHRPYSHHKEIAHPGYAQVQRTYSPAFCPPVPGMMREPGTNYLTILTSDGTMTLGDILAKNVNPQRAELIGRTGMAPTKKRR